MKNFAVIFDMDGVLIDSNSYIISSFNEFLKKHNCKINEEEFKEYMGITLEGILWKWREKYNLNVSYEELHSELTIIQKRVMGEDIRASENLVILMKELKKENIPMGVATSSGEERTSWFLNMLGIKQFFDNITTGDLVENHKPDPEIFLKAASALNMYPSKCIVLEDSENGIKAAKAAGMTAIAFLTKYQTEQELSKADRIITDFNQINYRELKKMISSLREHQ